MADFPKISISFYYLTLWRVYYDAVYLRHQLIVWCRIFESLIDRCTIGDKASRESEPQVGERKYDIYQDIGCNKHAMNGNPYAKHIVDIG